MRRVVFVDADNTLWDTDGVYAAAQVALLTSVEAAVGSEPVRGDRLAFVREVDQELARLHHDGLRYPPALLVRAMALAVEGRPPVRAARSAWRGGEATAVANADAGAIEDAFVAGLRADPVLRAGVPEGLAALDQLGASVVVLTESRADRVEATAARLGVATGVDRVLEGRKRADLYRRVLRLSGAAGPAHMVGDQLDRDVLPAREAGLSTIWFPGGFAPKWRLDPSDVGPDYTISSFAEVAGIVASAWLTCST